MCVSARVCVLVWEFVCVPASVFESVFLCLCVCVYGCCFSENMCSSLCFCVFVYECLSMCLYACVCLRVLVVV